jgi:acetylglutamate kinase
MSTGHSAPHPAKSRIATGMAKASILMEALPYIQRFSGKVVVVKYGGSMMTDLELSHSFAGDITLLSTVGIKTVIVHGGGPQISKAMEAEGIEPNFVDGLRVTDHQTMRVVQRMLVGEVNADIVSMLSSHGAEAIGVAGTDARLLRAVQKDERLGYVGEVAGVNTRLIESLLDDGLVPVIAPIAMGDDGHTYNVNADTVAAAIAGALGAHKLVYLTDVEGVYEDASDPSTLITRMDRDRLGGLLETMSGGMLPKLTSVAAALDQGVRRAHILDGRVQHVVLVEMFTREGVGTMMTHPGDDRP